MTQTVQFNISSLLAVKAELDSLLDQVAHDLEACYADPGLNSDVPQGVRSVLRRTCEMLQTLALEGATVFCEEIELLLQELYDGVLSPSSTYGETLQHAVSSLKRYLDALADGGSSSALCLFPEYQELQQARGVEMAFEVDLFFPDLQVELPPSVLARPGQDNPQAIIKTGRGKYQQALLKWLHDDNPDEALQSMRNAVHDIMECVPQNRQRAFWWVASALLDCMIYHSLPPEHNAKKLLVRIDLQMKSVAEGQAVEEHGSLREMLYLIAYSGEAGDTAAEVKRVYALQDHPGRENALSAGQTETVLELMRTQLEAVKESWEQCARERYVAPEFIEQLERLISSAGQLERNILQRLCHQIQNCVVQAQDAEQVQRIALDIAMALLLLGNGMEHYHHLGDEFHEQARILSQRLQAAIVGMEQDDNELADLITLYCRTEESRVMVVLASEVLGNLRQAEQGLGSLSSDIDKRQALTEIAGLLRQAQGGLHILSLDQPELLLHVLRQFMEYYAAGGSAAPDEIHTVAMALGTLQAYVQDLAHGQKPDTTPLAAALQDMQALQQPAVITQIPDAQQVAAQAVTTHALWEGDELLEVFLEEAQEVLDTMRANLEIIQLHPEDHETLAIIRRGFHTLKGSGRMVGLTDLAEVAWAVERAMNKWLQRNKFATPSLLKFILDAEAAFKGWVDSLHVHGSTQVDASDLINAAQQIETGMEPSIPAAQLVEPAPAASPHEVSVTVPAEVPADTMVSEVEPELPPAAVAPAALSLSQLGIAMEETAQHVAALLWHLTDLRESKQPAVSNDFLHEAHALTTVSRTMGVAQITELAYALEQWLETHAGHLLVLSDTQLSLLERTVAMLDDMSLAMHNRQEPQARPELVTCLQADAKAVAEQAEVPQPALMPAVSETGASQEHVKAVRYLPPVLEKKVALDDVDEHLLPIFLEEANDLFPQVGGDMRAWFEQPDEKALGRSLQRSLHTLKGSARMAGAMHLGDLIHSMEEMVVQAMAHAQYDAASLEKVEDCFDGIGDALEQLHGGRYMANQTTTGGVAAQDSPLPHADTESGGRAEYTMLRVRSDTADRLVNEAGEISVARSSIETELRGFKAGLLELTDSVSRLREQLREIEIQAEGQMQARVPLSEETAGNFDPLEFDRFTRLQELTRFMNESVHDVQTVQQSLLKNLDEASAALSAQSYLNRELQQNLMALRMVPFGNISERLHRIVRQTCKDTNKKANLELRGTTVELDRSVLDRMTAPLEHLLRNAIAHGVESPQQRKHAGKQSNGVICLSMRQENNEVIFEISDDGAGINLARLRQKAMELGMPPMGEKTSDEQVVQLIFTPGLTTATVVTEVSGRGIGMDVVRSEVAALGGRIEVSSKRGQGTHFIIHLPLTMVATQALLVRAGQSVYIIPSSMVEQIQQVKSSALKGIYRQGKVEWKGRPYPLHYLPRLLGQEECIPESHTYNRVLLLRSGEQRLAVHVDDLVGSQEVLVKNAGPQLAYLSGIAGAAVLGNGNVALVLNPAQLAQHIPGVRKAAIVEPALAPPLIMVVDDSLTVRKITSRLLVRAGYQVVTAKDGVDALEQLGEISPAVMLLDIEMPRMDGFELTKHLRHDPRTQRLPIIMITSRTAEKHRDYAHGLGVNAYFGKPYQEEELLHHIANLIVAS